MNTPLDQEESYDSDAMYGIAITPAEIRSMRTQVLDRARLGPQGHPLDDVAAQARTFNEDTYHALQSHREILPVSTGRRAAQLVFQLSMQHRRAAIFALICSTLFASLGALATFLSKHLVDTVQGHESPDRLYLYAAMIAGAGILSGIFSAINNAQVGVLGQGILVAMRDRVMFNAVNLPPGRLEKAGAGDALSRVADDVNTADSTVRNVIPSAVGALLTLIFSLLGLSALDWRLGLIGLAVSPLYWLALKWYLPRSRPLYRQRREALGFRTQALLGNTHGLETVHAYAAEDRQLSFMDGISRLVVTFSIRNNILIGSLTLRLRCAEFLGITGILVGSYCLYSTGSVTLGVVTASALFFVQLFGPMQALVWLADDIQSGGASLVRLVGVYDLPPQPAPVMPQVPRDASLEICDVAHSYMPGRQVLAPVSLRIESGESVALVGASGAGKSTLAAILVGTVVPTQGTIKYGGVPLDDIPLLVRRKQIALVSQDVHVFRGTVADDLRLARANASDQELWQALEFVAADTWVRALPQQLETLVGERGMSLSPEQGQHLALARLVLADPPIVIMDEATASAGSATTSDAPPGASDDVMPGASSAAPSASARVLEQAAQRISKTRTTIVIAHRLNQAVLADRIIVMNDGRVVEQGTHLELIRAKGTYSRLWAAWSG